jgi:hypothetical protein
VAVTIVRVDAGTADHVELRKSAQPLRSSLVILNDRRTKLGSTDYQSTTFE